MCHCINVEIGSYKATIPVWNDNQKRVTYIDYCIIPEIINLWREGVVTIESCCGHNKRIGYIAVDDYSIHKMIELGYTEEKPNIFFSKT
jgi:hypothetical protein